MNYAPLRQPAPIILAIGAAIGLVIGLLIGWVFWPVEWTGATLRDLYPAEKAEYIAAVADAYAIYDNQEARAIAQRRLAPLGDENLQQSFEESLQYFQESQFSDRAIRDSNIRRLAVALNMSQPTTAAAPQALPTLGAETTSPPVTDALVTPAPSEATGGLGWIGWLLWLLTALLLLAGGIYILSKAGLPDFQSFLKPRQKATDEIDEFDEPTQPRRPQQNAALVQPGEAGAFEEEDDWPSIIPPVVGSPRRNFPQSPQDDKRTRRPNNNVYVPDNEPYEDDPVAEDGFDEDDFGDDFDSDLVDNTDDRDHDYAQEPFENEDDESPVGQRYTIDVAPEHDTPADARPARYAAPPSPTAQPIRPDVAPDPDQNRKDNETPKAALVDVVPSGRVQTARSTTMPTSEHAPTPMRARHKVIDQHIFHYRIGMAEYDESRPIVDSQSGKYIGEFGMGASHKNGVAQTGPDQLVALEVWLFDKSDERNLGNQTRILLSEYAVDQNLEPLFLKERQDNPRPFTAQPGIHFQLESQNLLLNCTIVDVEYSINQPTKGIFQEITVDMTVQQKSGK